MKREECREGVRVSWRNGEDSGKIVSKDGSIFCSDSPDWVWVEWDSCGLTRSVKYERLTVLEPLQETKAELTEEQAVMFLLSKGYAVSKGKD